MFLGIDIGTGSTKAVLADAEGRVLREARRTHRTSTPQPGWFEHDAETIWWGDVVALCREVVAADGDAITAVCCSGIGPASLLTDERDRPIRPAILYGIDTRSAAQAAAMNASIGHEQLLARVGNPLSTQSVGPKLTWVAEHEPEFWKQARHLYSAPGWVVRRLTGEYVMDRYSASASDPLYDLSQGTWWEDGWESYDRLARPRLAEPAEVVGQVSRAGADETNLPVGVPVVAGTIDALAEAYSVGCEDVGDTMIMYGSTIFMIQVAAQMVPTTTLWATEGLAPRTYSLAAGMATGGLVTQWVSESVGQEFAELSTGAEQVPPGSEGLLLLPYFAGERTPVYDPAARGAYIGLTLAHTPAHLYRSALEGVAMGIRHNVEAMADAGAPARRLVAVGGGTAQRVWTQIVSDVTGLPQDLTAQSVGASYGDARLAADALGVDTSGWNPVDERLEPDHNVRDVYDRLFRAYQDVYPGLRNVMHELGEPT